MIRLGYNLTLGRTAALSIYSTPALLSPNLDFSAIFGARHVDLWSILIVKHLFQHTVLTV